LALSRKYLADMTQHPASQPAPTTSPPEPYEPLLTAGGWRIGGPDWRKPWPKGLMWLTWFGAGFSFHAPGTVGSLNALPMAVLIAWLGGQWVLALAAIIPFILGWIYTARYLREEPNSADPQWIVIDEVVGLWITLSVVPLSIIWFALGFALFRVFDIVKPWPVSWADRSVPGALGIMLDDVLAGLYAAGVLLGLQYLWDKFF
jgi:phosphatidylglycerophosphatase A